MNTQVNSQLFSELSSQAASHTRGGHWARRSVYAQPISVTVIVPSTPVAASAPVARPAGGGTINITNPDIDDGSIVNIPAGSGNINMTRPDIDDGSIFNF